MSKSWFQVCKKALYFVQHRDEYAYFYGAKGVKLTATKMKNLIEAYPEHFKKYSAEEIEQIKRNSLGKIGVDCSGLVALITGVDDYSTGFYDRRSEETSVLHGVAGQLLYTTWRGKGRHIGLDLGYGFMIDAAYEATDAKKEIGMDGIRLLTFSEFNAYHGQEWEHSFRIPEINYKGSYATDPNAK